MNWILKRLHELFLFQLLFLMLLWFTSRDFINDSFKPTNKDDIVRDNLKYFMHRLLLQHAEYKDEYE